DHEERAGRRRDDDAGDHGRIPAVAVQEAGDLTDGLPQNDAGRHDVREPPEGEAVPTDGPDGREQSPEEGAVDRQPAVPHRDDLERTDQVSGWVVEDDVVEARADQRGQDDGPGRVRDHRGVESFPTRLPCREPDPREDGERDDDSVGPELIGSQLDEDRIHRVTPPSPRGPARRAGRDGGPDVAPAGMRAFGPRRPETPRRSGGRSPGPAPPAVTAGTTTATRRLPRG